MLVPVLDEGEILKRARQAPTLRDVGNLAAEVLLRHFGTASLVMTPIRSGGIMRGGRPSARANIERLRKTIAEFQEANIGVFNQLMFKSVIDAHRIKWRESDKSHATGYYEAILYDFYGPILATGGVKVLFLLPGWEKSRSCKYVRKSFGKQGRVIELA